MSIAQPVEQAHRHQPALPVAKLGKACVDIAGLNHVAIFLLGHPRHLAIAMARVDVAAEQRELFCGRARRGRSEEHTSELQSLMRSSYAVFCLKKQKHTT